MAGKEKTEDFEDDFEIDAFDAEDDSFSDGAETLPGGSEVSSPKTSQTPAPQKKKSGGAIFGLLLLGLLGGGAWYGYQNNLIPGLDPSGPSPGNESVIPGLPLSDEQLSAPADDSAAAFQQDGAAMPPQPEPSSASLTNDGSLSEGAVPADTESEALVETPALVSPSNTEGDVLTPMPELSGDSLAALQPLESPDTQEISGAAEKDGAALESDGADSLSVSTTDIDSLSASSESDGSLSFSGSASETSSEVPEVTDTPSDPLLEPAPETQITSDSAPEESGASPSEATEAETQDVEGTAAAEISDSTIAPLDEDSLLSETEKSVDAVTEIDPVVAAEPEGSPEPQFVEDAPDASAPPSPAPAVADQASETPKSEPAASDKDVASTAAPVTTANGDKVVQGALGDKGIAQPAQNAVPDKSPKADVVKKPAPIKWTLKSASPDFAVLYDRRTGDVKTVEVGDRVSGLGKIQSITRINGKWVVKGTGGKISQ